MKVFLFSSDIKGFTYLKSTFKELKSKNHEVFFLYGDSNHVIIHPPSSLDKFNFDSTSKIDFTQGIFIESIGLNIPYVPDYLILTRDRWMPEQHIIYEFKQKYPQTKIAYIELNTNLKQAIEIKLEAISRTNYPQNQIDIFFDHSSKCLENKKITLNWEGWNRGVVVGNPSWDDISQKDIENCSLKYNIDPNKTQIMFCLSGGVTRKKSLEYLEILSSKLDRSKYQLFLKPMPGEKQHHQLKKDYEPKFVVDGIDGFIFDQVDLIPMSHICEYNIGYIGSVNYGGVKFKKQLVNLDLLEQNDQYNDLDFFLQDDPKVRENWTSKFWMRIHNLSNQQEFINLIGLDNIEKFKHVNKQLKIDLELYTHTFDEDLNFLKSTKKNTIKLLPYFDDFDNENSSKRIVEYLEKHLEVK